ncbi:MAG: hypothetical protein J1E80_06345 [Desulfovibrionaceae bacterium]|nr:hypothetical protein [Desulfovibrionaceae bacterium]
MNAVFRVAVFLCLGMACLPMAPAALSAAGAESETSFAFSAEKEVDGSRVRVDLRFPGHAAVGESVPLHVNLAFERQMSGVFPSVSVTRRTVPDGASAPEVLPGVPVTDIRFSAPGHYDLEAEIGLVFKNSCGGARLVPLAAVPLAVDVF